jgi:hypothetical protein
MMLPLPLDRAAALAALNTGRPVETKKGTAYISRNGPHSDRPFVVHPIGGQPMRHASAPLAVATLASLSN